MSIDKAEKIDLVGINRYADWQAPTQGDRNSCIAFAVTACVELRRAGTGAKPMRDFQKLSPQFLYWFMRQQSLPEPPPGWAEGATKLSQAKAVLENYGICSLASCPYFEQLPAGEPIAGAKPSDAAIEEAEKNHVTDFVYKDCPEPKDRPGNAQLVFDQLLEGRPVAIAIPVFLLDQQGSLTNWSNAVTVNSGEVLDPPEPASGSDPSQEERRAPGHAVCIVGFQPDVSEPTGGWFIFRNSRGLNWAKQIDVFNQDTPNVPARGYGAISATHVERFCWEILSPKG